MNRKFKLTVIFDQFNVWIEVLISLRNKKIKKTCVSTVVHV